MLPVFISLLVQPSAKDNDRYYSDTYRRYYLTIFTFTPVFTLPDLNFTVALPVLFSTVMINTACPSLLVIPLAGG